MEMGQIALIAIVLFGLLLLWGRREAKKSGRLDAYNAKKAARNGAAVRPAEDDSDQEPTPGPVAADVDASAVIPWVEEPDWIGARLVGSEIQVRGSTPAEIKIAVRELRLMKKDEQAKKRELGALKAEQRAEWRERQAGRYRTAGMGRGTFGRLARAGIQANRRSERMAHTDKINTIERQQAVHDRNVLAIDRLIAECEATLLRAERD